ncbi:hypothetical protein HNR65_003569 [Desulfosalsimonas propionicica]|uniref:Uncharacterized protein n=1 Tax=Desulfosalsimonas propionicica TaxID=332175 RepID=A0A7W0CCF5_9BACT|nr:hypothetical protein [Desulfosalsimonas propionicica]
MKSHMHPQQGFRSCLGILRLGKSYGEERLVAAAKRANAIGGLSYKSVESILKNGLDQKPLPDKDSSGTALSTLTSEGKTTSGKRYGSDLNWGRCPQPPGFDA